MHILLTEDTEFISFLYKRQLEKAGYTIDLCTTGKDTLYALTKNTYDLILLDVILPDMNGLDILKQIKNNEKTKNVPVILLSNAEQNSLQQLLDLGAAGYLIKSNYSPDQIVEKVQEILKKTLRTTQ